MMAWMRRLIYNTRRHENGQRIGELTVTEFYRAETVVIRMS